MRSKLLLVGLVPDDATQQNDGAASKRRESEAAQKDSFYAAGLMAHKKLVVIVDDDPFVRRVLEKTLSVHGFQVVAALSDGAEIISSINSMQPKPEVILMDERMPRVSGTEAARTIHAEHPDISIVFISADASAREAAMKAGAKLFLTKPLSTPDLVHHINSV